MKNLKKVFSTILILLVFSANAGIFSLPVLASEKGDLYSRQIGNGSFSKIREKSDFTSDFLIGKSIDEQSELEKSRSEIKSLEGFKPIEKEDKNYIEGEVLVKYKKNKIDLETSLGRVAAENFSRTKSMEKKEDLKRINVSVLKIKDNKTVEEKIAELKNDPNVEYAEPNYKRYPTAIDSNDTYKNLLWGLDNTGQEVNGITGTNDADIDAPEAWAISEGNSNVIVAVIDSGVAYNHPDLIANMWDGSACVDENNGALGGCNHGYDYEDNDKIPLDNFGHGTHVAGTIGAIKNNGKGIIGVSPNIKIMAIKFSSNVAEEVQAINFAINNGAKIINASFSGGDYSQTEYDAINAFRNAGGLFITAAGNETNNNDAGVHNYPCDNDLDNIICVAATDQDDNLTSWSNYGITSVDVGAPGRNIYSTIAQEILVLFEDFEGVTPPLVPAGFVPTGDWGTYDLGGVFWGKVLYGDAYNVPYATTSNSIITSPAYNLSAAGGAFIDFWARCDTEYNTEFWTDYMALEISSDGSSFAEFFKFDEFFFDYLNGESPLNPSGSAAYHLGNISIPGQYLTNNFKFRFRWVANGNEDTGGGDGCLVDDIKITKYSDGSDEQYGFGEGTSMATPHVAGLAGLIWGYKPELTYSQVKDIILSTGDDNSSLSGKTVTGKRINAFNALESLTDTTAPILAEVTPVQTPTNDNTPDYTFNSDEAGTISYDGGCTSTTTEAIAGDNTISFNELMDGTYASCTIAVTDTSDNTSDPLLISSFTIDTVIPVITLLGDNPVDLYVGDSYTDAGATALDDVDGDITVNIVVGGDTVDTGTVGTYIITYNVSDVAGNPATEVTRTVIVSEVPDNTPPTLAEVTPVLTPTNDNTPDYIFNSDEAGTISYEGGCISTTTEAIAGDNTITFNSLADGTYDSCTITVTDEAGNPSDPLAVTEFIIDTVPPVITLIGSLTVDIYVGDTYEDEGATATDNIDGDITGDIIINNPVDINIVGTYLVTYNVTDAAGNPAEEVTRTVNVSETPDTTAPVITAPVDQTFEATGPITTPTLIEATATDNVDPNPVITYSPHSFSVGTTSVTWTATDASGNQATATSNVTIEDTTAPIITGTPTDINVEIISSESGAIVDYTVPTATDLVDGSVAVTCTPASGSTFPLGDTTVTCAATDAAGNTATSTFKVTVVVDTTPPIITLLGDNPITIEVGTTYNDAGATASDNHDGNITGNMVIINPVNSNTIGIYTVTYNVTDSSGNPATEVTRTVNVVDTTPPVITLLGENPITIPVNTVYDDAGATASDNYDGVITNNIVTVNSVDTNTIGTYYVTYNVTDSSSNPAIEIIRTVNVVDVSTPIISLLGNNPLTIEVGSVYSDAGATATDDVDGDISGNIVVVNNVNSNILGTYTVTYNVSDSSGNHAPEAIRTVNVVDTTAPVIVLLGDNPASVEVGYEYNDAGATANDNYDGDITDSIVTVNPVDYNTVGTYTVTYNVTDSSGNSADEVTRTVIISVDTTPPTISGLSNDTVPKKSKTWNWNSTDSTAKFRYVIDQSATSTVTGDYTDIKTATQSSGDGVYYLHVQAKDDAGNESTIVTVSAILDNTPPVAVLSGLPTDSTTETTANITVGGQDVVYYKYKLDSGNYSDEIATTTPITLSGLSTGLHVVYVMGRDTAGNWQTEENKTSYSWTINPISTGGGGGGGGGGGATTPPSYKTGDINKDNKVDKYDFSMMMAAWGKTGSNTSDLNGDNKVDKYDFALLMSKWSTM